MLRPAGPHDLDLIRAWRNQPANRAVSINQHVISREEHQAWWNRTKDDPARRVLVFAAEERPLGIVNFFSLELDKDIRTGAWGFFLDTETIAREGTTMLIWTRLMGEALAYAFDELKLDRLDAEVLPENEAVRAMNRRFRFTEHSPEEREVGGRRIVVIPVSLHRADRLSRGRR